MTIEDPPVSRLTQLICPSCFELHWTSDCPCSLYDDRPMIVTDRDQTSGGPLARLRSPIPREKADGPQGRSVPRGPASP
jgi:hypothetical protein